MTTTFNVAIEEAVRVSNTARNLTELAEAVFSAARLACRSRQEAITATADALLGIGLTGDQVDFALSTL